MNTIKTLEDQLVFLSAPYTHPNREIMDTRAKEIERAAVILTRCGVLVYSPITSWHEAAKNYNLPTDARFWEHHNRTMLERCDAVVVLGLPGWRESLGVGIETDQAERHQIPTFFLTRDDLGMATAEEQIEDLLGEDPPEDWL